jgi:large subunit ribosomal protein L4
MSNKIDLYNCEGKVTSQIELPESLFDVEVNPELMALAIRVLRANSRQGTSKVKGRGEVNRTKHKVWKQKGTGRARHGSKNAPIFVGGGVAHGPSGNQSYKLHLPKKMHKLAFKGALTETAKAGNIIVIDGLDKIKPTTKDLAKVLSSLKITEIKTVLMLESPAKNILDAGRNLSKLTITQAKRSNVMEIMNADKLLIHKPALDVLLATYVPEIKIENVKTAVKPVAKPAVKPVTKPIVKKTIRKSVAKKV